MSYETRRELYKQIEEARGMPLITYVTSLRQNASGQIAPDVIAELIRQLKDIPAQIKEVDFLIVSNGGDPIVAWRLVNLLSSTHDHELSLPPGAVLGTRNDGDFDDNDGGVRRSPPQSSRYFIAGEDAARCCLCHGHEPALLSHDIQPPCACSTP
ncbi:MAG: hypothetical protein H6643_12490 [Caldilineaceae bacterium]|nr:hypothetical protein [Caldilineaceae bacterium]